MTQEQEEQLRVVSKFLRMIFAEDMSACATILTAEAELLGGRDIEKNADTIIKALTAVQECCNDGIAKLKTMKVE